MDAVLVEAQRFLLRMRCNHTMTVMYAIEEREAQTVYVEICDDCDAERQVVRDNEWEWK